MPIEQRFAPSFEKGKLFLFERKKQKTFAPWLSLAPPVSSTMAAMRRLLLLLCLAALITLAWYLPNQPIDPPGGHPGDRFASLSFGAYRPWESPLTDHFPTTAEADLDMALVAKEAGAVRTYSALEGALDTAALAQKHGLKLWQGIWLGADRAHNEQEIARGIAFARRYPDTVTRVVVGNEVLLRRDLPPAELIADIDRVKHAIHQPVAYADVWNFWQEFPEVASHVDIMLIHILPYWEDTPTGIDHAVDHVRDTFHAMRRLFPGKQIGIGETGWPSRGRQRADAVPSRVNEARFLRAFLTLSQQEHFDYNFIEAFDQTWKYESEGIVGANWGVFDAGRHIKIPVSGPISEDPDWPFHAAIGIAAGLALTALGLRSGATKSRGRDARICVAGMALGAAWGWGLVVALATLYDIHLELAAIVNVTGQGALAILAMLRLSGRLAPAQARTSRQTSAALRALFRQARLPPLATTFEDMNFLFVWTAAVMQMLLVFDPRYREFPLSTFAVPLLVTIGRLVSGAREAADGPALLAAGALAAGALASAIQEGALNGQSLLWNGCALLLAAPLLASRLPARNALPSFRVFN
jgi:exo-beta-1,3-glucanase (GH17 family)